MTRYGGEEFVVVLPNADESGAYTVADRLIRGVRSCGIKHETSSVADCVTISIGATTGYVKPAQTGDDYIKIADKALYASKQNGRNRYTHFYFGERIK